MRQMWEVECDAAEALPNQDDYPLVRLAELGIEPEEFHQWVSEVIGGLIETMAMKEENDPVILLQALVASGFFTGTRIEAVR